MKQKPAWLENPPCRGRTELFYSEELEAMHKAVTICSSCPFTDLCLEYTLEFERGRSHANRWGIAAGTTPEQRRELEMYRRGNVSATC